MEFVRHFNPNPPGCQPAEHRPPAETEKHNLNGSKKGTRKKKVFMMILHQDHKDSKAKIHPEKLSKNAIDYLHFEAYLPKNINSKCLVRVSVRRTRDSFCSCQVAPTFNNRPEGSTGESRLFLHSQ